MKKSMKIQQGFSNVPKFFREYLKEYLNYIKERLKKDLISIILYGSVARGSWDKESDIDLLLILSNDYFEENDEYKISEILIDFYEKCRTKEVFEKYKYHTIQILSLSVNDLKKFRTLFYDIALDGIILYDPKDIGSKLITSYQKRIEEKDLKRIYINENDFYWKRKDIKFGEMIEL
jgi:uncharacterized protein